MRIVDELPGELGQLGVALGERREVGQLLADVVGRGLGRASAREEPEGAALGGVDQLGDLVELGGAEPVAAGLGQVASDVEDRLLAVVERAADVEADPGLGVLVLLFGGL